MGLVEDRVKIGRRLVEEVRVGRLVHDRKLRCDLVYVLMAYELMLD